MEDRKMHSQQSVNRHMRTEGSGMLKKFPKKGKFPLFIVVGSFVIVLAGVLTGWLLSGRAVGKSDTGQTTSNASAVPSVETGKDEAGISDESKFPDQAEGVLVEGGIEGEGTHHLDRGMGANKDVYLTSTVIDLQSFVGKKVKVWGQTISGKSAGWLMDVGKIKVIN